MLNELSVSILIRVPICDNEQKSYITKEMEEILKRRVLVALHSMQLLLLLQPIERLANALADAYAEQKVLLDRLL